MWAYTQYVNGKGGLQASALTSPAARSSSMRSNLERTKLPENFKAEDRGQRLEAADQTRPTCTTSRSGRCPAPRRASRSSCSTGGQLPAPQAEASATEERHRHGGGGGQIQERRRRPLPRSGKGRRGRSWWTGSVELRPEGGTGGGRSVGQMGQLGASGDPGDADRRGGRGDQGPERRAPGPARVQDHSPTAATTRLDASRRSKKWFDDPEEPGRTRSKCGSTRWTRSAEYVCPRTRAARTSGRRLPG